MAPAALSKTELFERLAAGHAAGITVVTPNRRLAQTLRAEFDASQAARGLAVWEDADILPLDAFVARRYEEARYADGGAGLPLLLSDAQASALWQDAIAGSKWAGALLDVPATAARAMQAWQLAHQWGIAGALENFPGNEDTRAFNDWAKAYARRLKKDGLTDSSLLFDLDPGKKTKSPKLLVAYAFDIVSKQAEGMFARFEFAQCAAEKKRGNPAKASFVSPKDELDSAARWARGRLEEGKRRIGVVVPDLKLRRREVARVFGRVMGSPTAFNLSIGEPLADYPLVAFALSLLALSLADVEFENASRLIRSPFFGGAQSEMAARARFDARLRDEAGATISLPKLIARLDGCPLLRSHLESVFELKAEPRSPHDWARHFTAVLEAAGFPGERAADSAEYQTRAKFNEVLGELARLSIVTSKMNGTKALAQLCRLCADTLFQPESEAAPVQVLGLLEAAGIGFDALWVSGLTDGQWPQRAHADPFLPVALQRKAGIPEASAESSLALDRLRTEAWLAAADEVVLSWARREEDRDLLPSPLIAEVEAREIRIPDFASHRELIFESRKTETFTDEKAPALKESTVRGGTRLLSDQAACPFRAYAHHRLRAERLEAPEPGLDALQRGNLVHALMAGIWQELRRSESLQGDFSSVISHSAKKAVAELKIEGRFAELEVERLIRLASDWLEVEKARPAFEVIQVEEKQERSIGGLTLSGRIDRMDKLADGTHALIDYKTGAQLSPRQWMGERPDEPQLPFYAATASEPLSAVAFAKFRAGDMKFMGFSAGRKLIPGVQEAESWPGLLEGWRASLAKLAGDFAAGEAQVDPKNGLATCRNCDLQTLCRVHEKLSALAEEGGEE